MKKLFALLLALVMVMSLAACGGGRTEAAAPAEKPTDALVAQTIEIIKSLQAGNGMPATDVLVNNGKIDVMVYELPPIVVTKDNAKEVFANDPGRMELLK